MQGLASGKRVLELGSWQGRSTCCFSDVALLVVSVDHHEGDDNAGYFNTATKFIINTIGRRNIVPLVCHASRVSTILGLTDFNLAYVDLSHSREATREACMIAANRMDITRSTIAVHDYDRPEVRQGVGDTFGGKEPDGVVGSLAWFDFKL